MDSTVGGVKAALAWTGKFAGLPAEPPANWSRPLDPDTALLLRRLLTSSTTMIGMVRGVSPAPMPDCGPPTASTVC